MTTPEPSSGIRRIVVLAILVGVLVGAYFGARALAAWVGGLGGAPDVTAPMGLEPGRAVSVLIEPGWSARQIGVTLAEAGVVPSAAAFELAVRSEGVAERLQAGRYDLETGMDSGEVIELMLVGPVVETFRVTVREGLWIGEVIDSLAEQTDYTAAELESVLAGGTVSSDLLSGPSSELASWEGLLFPDTYDFAIDATPTDILQGLADTMSRRVADLDWSRLEARGLSVYEGLVVASMVEAEAGVDADRPLIASVIVNRIEAGMLLEIDATVVYAIGERGIQLTQSQLEIDSPYNTRRFPGLPPTPIGAPGRRSLEAAASPPQTDYLFYVLTSPTGQHSFTASYDEFLRFKQEARDAGLIP